MKYLALALILILSTSELSAQSDISETSTQFSKPPLDTSAFSHNWKTINWTDISLLPAISNNGKYVSYCIQDHFRLPSTMIIQDINGYWKKQVPGIKKMIFTEDSKRIICLNNNDSLLIITLNSEQCTYVPDVSAFQLFRQKQTEWLAYEHGKAPASLVVQNMNTAKKLEFDNVSDYKISENGGNLVLKTVLKKDTALRNTLSWVELSTGKSNMIISSANDFSSYIFDNAATKLSFIIGKSTPAGVQKAIWIYSKQTGSVSELVNNYSPGIDSNLQISNIDNFTNDGKRLFIHLIEKNKPAPEKNAVQVDVWSYTDKKIQSQQLKELGPRSYLAVVSLNNSSVLRLQQENDVVAVKTDDYIYMTNNIINPQEAHWNTAAKIPYNIVSVVNGQRRPVSINLSLQSQSSPNGKFFVGNDNTWEDLFSCELATNTIRNITAAVPVQSEDIIKRDELDRPLFKKSRGLTFASYMADGQYILMYDEFDIWKIDLTSGTPPVNLTNGYGRKNNIVLRIAGFYHKRAFKDNEKIILSAFNKQNKNSGFFSTTIGGSNNPELLSMGPYCYSLGPIGSSQVKARDTTIYLLSRESTTASPNLYWTNDFKQFNVLSDIHPEKKYNWMTAELLEFITLDGRMEQGVLYKPENMDTTKRYPVIIHYYERKSQDLNKFHRPFVSTGADLDIAWFVSHGYLVFTPDIHYKIGETGKSAMNSILAAAQYLARFTWVNGSKIGIQGHSFGGYETNYIVTHTNFFAAAMSSAGPSDIVSLYNNFTQFFPEVWQLRIGHTLWERPDLYIENSPVFSANKVTTPVLLMANKKDGNVPFDQGLEFFMALRRLGKQVWMLQYDKGSHGIFYSDVYTDYVIHMTQFFDHYLKDQLAPKWMIQGIPARLKGVDSGTEIGIKIQ